MFYETANPGNRLQRGGVLRLASYPACEDRWSAWGIVKSDLFGAVAGFFVAGLPGVAVGGLSSSAMTVLWQVASWLACIIVGWYM